MNTSELGFLKNYTYAADKKEWAEIAKNDSCTVLVKWIGRS